MKKCTFWCSYGLDSLNVCAHKFKRHAWKRRVQRTLGQRTLDIWQRICSLYLLHWYGIFIDIICLPKVWARNTLYLPLRHPLYKFKDLWILRNIIELYYNYKTLCLLIHIKHYSQFTVYWHITRNCRRIKITWLS